jgi:hypothetical protein
MGSKLKHIKFVNVLLEQRYLNEQAQTGTTQTGTTTPQSGATTPPVATTTQPSLSPEQTKELEKMKTTSNLDSKYLKCGSNAGPKVADINGKKIHQLNNTFCIG